MLRFEKNIVLWELQKRLSTVFKTLAYPGVECDHSRNSSQNLTINLARLTENEQRFRSLFENNPDLMIFQDWAGTVRYWTPTPPPS